MVSLERILSDNSTQFICSGSIISSRYVLTAASCMIDKDNANEEEEVDLTDDFRNIIEEDYLTIRAGSSMKEQGGSKHRVAKYFIPPEASYTPSLTTKLHDIALLVVKEPIYFDNKTTKAIELPMPDDAIEPGAIGTIGGWDFANKNELTSVQLKIADNNFCLRSGNELGVGEICAQPFNATNYPKQRLKVVAANGTALVIRDKLVGVATSWPVSNLEGSSYIFTNVAMFKNWIDDSVG